MIDLHVHSTASDGTLTPAELVRYAFEHGVHVMALTDHDTVAGVGEALDEASVINGPSSPAGTAARITVIPGIEISAAYKRRDIHILGYYVDAGHKVFADMLEDQQREREVRNRRMADMLRAAGMPIDLDAIAAVSGSTTITRAHIARSLMEQGFCRSVSEAMDRFIGNEAPFYVPREFMTQKKAIETIHEAGGIAVLAHPLKYGASRSELEALVSELRSYGLQGIETYYSSNISNDEDVVRHLAIKNGLIMTGGSDFHGSNKPGLEIGTGFGNLRVPESAYTGLKAAHAE